MRLTHYPLFRPGRPSASISQPDRSLASTACPSPKAVGSAHPYQKSNASDLKSNQSGLSALIRATFPIGSGHFIQSANSGGVTLRQIPTYHETLLPPPRTPASRLPCRLRSFVVWLGRGLCLRLASLRTIARYTRILLGCRSFQSLHQQQF